MSITHGSAARPHVLLTESGAYIESQFFTFVSEFAIRSEAQSEFETFRDTKISQALRARGDQRERVYLNSNGWLSPLGNIMVWFRRE